MNKVMETLFEIEDKATGIMDEVAKEKKEMEQDFNLKMKEFENKVGKDTELKIEAMKVKMEKDMEPEKEKIQKGASDFLQSYEEKFNKEKENIIANIVNRITECGI